ncbi:MAG: hypothetical protein IPG50_34075 [Myxococcales bacterium]|nr:hypothetical protein [Myxococcales bacterium]
MNSYESTPQQLETLNDEDLGSIAGGRIDVNPCPPQPTFPDPDCWAGPEYL